VNEGEALEGMGMKASANFWQGTVGEVIGQSTRSALRISARLASKLALRERRAVFAHQSIPSPVVADCNPAPVSPDQSQPLVRAVLFWGVRSKGGSGIRGW
jgi:hypothetical protein